MADLVLLEFFTQRATINTEAVGCLGLIVFIVAHDSKQQGLFNLADYLVVQSTSSFPVEVVQVLC